MENESIQDFKWGLLSSEIKAVVSEEIKKKKIWLIKELHWIVFFIIRETCFWLLFPVSNFPLIPQVCAYDNQKGQVSAAATHVSYPLAPAVRNVKDNSEHMTWLGSTKDSHYGLSCFIYLYFIIINACCSFWIIHRLQSQVRLITGPKWVYVRSMKNIQ